MLAVVITNRPCSRSSFLFCDGLRVRQPLVCYFMAVSLLIGPARRPLLLSAPHCPHSAHQTIMVTRPLRLPRSESGDDYRIQVPLLISCFGSQMQIHAPKHPSVPYSCNPTDNYIRRKGQYKHSDPHCFSECDSQFNSLRRCSCRRFASRTICST
jgi:hypothetical protein